MPEEEPRGILDRLERLEADRRRRRAPPKDAPKRDAARDLDLDRIG